VQSYLLRGVVCNAKLMSMTDAAVPPGTPHELLSATRELTRRVRTTQRGTGFPLLVLGVVTLLAAPFERYGHVVRTCESNHPAGSYVCSLYPSWLFVYWPIALTLAYVAIAGTAIRRSLQRGVGTRIQPYVIAGVVLALALTAITLWIAHNPTAHQEFLGGRRVGSTQLSTYLLRLVSPQAAIGLALLVLARIERNWPLLAVAVGYLVIIAGAVNFGWVIRSSHWVFLPHLVITGGVLVVAGIYFLFAERRATP
jgi:hypothetical protein